LEQKKIINKPPSIDDIPPHPKIYYTCYVFDESLDYIQKSKRDGRDVVSKLHTQKALVISSFYQFHQEFYEIFKAIKHFIAMNIAGFELEKLIHSLVFDIPSPTPGMTKVAYNYCGLISVEFQLNPINNIPKSGSDLKHIINILGLRNVFAILKYVILEVPVIIFGQDKNILANSVKSLEEFLFPFSYPFSVIQILPKIYFKSLEKLSCFIVGINQKYTNDFFELNDINLKDKNYVVVTLSEQDPYYIYVPKKNDRCGILLKDYKKTIKKEEQNEKYMVGDVNFPKHYQTKTMKNINQLFHDKNGKPTNINNIQNDSIRYQFFYFFTSMLRHYKPFLVNEKKNLINLYPKIENDSIDINSLFKFQEFILKSDDSMDFFNYFMSTRIWKNFLIKNLYPSTIEEKFEILLLDENIRKKKNKSVINKLFKDNTPFLLTDLFDIKKTETIKIVNDEEEEMHLQEKINDIFPILDTEKMELLYKNFLKSNVSIKNLYQDFYKESLNIIKDKQYLEGYNNVGYKLNLNEELKSNNEHYTYKLWLILVCYTFKYLDKGEKWIIFNEFLREIHDIVPHYKITIIDQFLSDLMFSTFIEYGDKTMCSLLYKELNNISCVKEDYLTFTNLHKKFVDKKEEFKFTITKEGTTKERDYSIFDSKGKRLVILLASVCKICNLNCFLRPAMMNYSLMLSDKITFKCQVCHNTYDAKIDMSNSGLFLRAHEKDKEKGCQLYSPKYLYYYIKNLGDFNIQTFYKEHIDIFINLIILFYLIGSNFDFIFPYKEKSDYVGFDPNKLKLDNTGSDNYIRIDLNDNKKKWYEDILQIDDKLKKRRMSKLLPSKKGSVGTFKVIEGLSSTAFYQKSLKKKEVHGLKHSKTINEN
jgi:hypothetical protein